MPITTKPHAAAAPRRPNARTPITSLVAGDRVTVHLKGRAIDRIHVWGGEVLAVDGTAIKLKTSWSRRGLSPCSSDGVRVIPWATVEGVRLELAP